MIKNDALKTIEDLKEIVQRGEVLVLDHKSYFSIGAFVLLTAGLKLLSGPIAATVGAEPDSVFTTGKAVLAAIFTLIAMIYFRKDIAISSGRLKSAHQLGATLGFSTILTGVVLSKLGYSDLMLPMTMCLLGNLIAIYCVFSSRLIKYTGWSLIIVGILSLFGQKLGQVDLFLWQLTYIAISMVAVGFISRAEKLKHEASL